MNKAGEGSRPPSAEESTDPVLAVLGLGRSLWENESGDAFIERLRSESFTDAPPPVPGIPSRSLPEAVWHRIRSHQGEQFHTARKLSFTYKVEGAGIWFFRDGRRINRKLARAQVDSAISRCPLTSTTEIKDLMDYAYLYGVLMDPRIRAEAL